LQKDNVESLKPTIDFELNTNDANTTEFLDLNNFVKVAVALQDEDNNGIKSKVLEDMVMIENEEINRIKGVWPGRDITPEMERIMILKVYADKLKSQEEMLAEMNILIGEEKTTKTANNLNEQDSNKKESEVPNITLKRTQDLLIKNNTKKSVFEVIGVSNSKEVKFTIMGEDINQDLIDKIYSTKPYIQIFSIKRISTIDIL